MVEAAGGEEFFEISQDAGVPGEECLGSARIGTPLLGEILALRRLVPDEPLEAATGDGRLDKRRHIADDIAEEVEFAVVDEASDAVLVTLRGQRGDDDGDGRERRVAVFEVHIAMPLGDLDCATQNALQRVHGGIGLDLGPEPAVEGGVAKPGLQAGALLE